MSDKVTREHVEQAVADLRAKGLMADTGPAPDGSRSAEQWLAAVREDAGIVQLQLEMTLRDGFGRVRCLGAAVKECRRMQNDIYRFAQEVHGITRVDIDRQGPS